MNYQLNTKKMGALAFTIFLFVACNKNAGAQNPDQVSSADDDSATEELIIGGHAVTKKSEIAATTVSLLDVAQGTLCTASILADDIAITAAHCVDGNPADMEISFGPKSAGHEVRPVEETIVSPAWSVHQNDEANSGDIALVKFSGGLPPGATPATLMKASHRLSNGEIVTLAGFGISKGSGSGAGQLRTVDVKIAKAQFSKTEVSLDQHDHKGACHGDSGGPAFIQDNNGGLLLWGVTSRGIDDPTDHCVGESVYTRIQPYARWINSIVRKWHR